MQYFSVTDIPSGFSVRLANGDYKLDFDKHPFNHRLKATLPPSALREIDRWERLTHHTNTYSL